MKQSDLKNHETVLNRPEKLVNRLVTLDYESVEFKEIFANARKSKTVPIKEIQHKIMAYREKYKSYGPFSEPERKMLRDVMDIWG